MSLSTRLTAYETPSPVVYNKYKGSPAVQAQGVQADRIRRHRPPTLESVRFVWLSIRRLKG